ncbi:similar to vacuolar transporter chaperone [Botrytis cinerea T4]|uniref:Similar to vacuolar transporter chaperone n=1 Tax=Botryotinia fuckeliana (strain T4) TaxID=999810 RepID=G2Y3S9_BOTF4|nr:similar to vacuolar transporter chaperone [Botrytis cinerea T4]
MRFGQTLKKSIYPPWKDQYIDYAKLKHLLREDSASEGDDRPWTADDETKFCEEILNVQLEKIASFQESTFKNLEQRANTTGEKLKELAPEDGKSKDDLLTSKFKKIEEELDAIINDTKELKKYSSINYTAFLKIVKKHDRKRGNNYKIRPMVQMSLQKRPFNSEQGYSALLNQLSMMYFVVRQQLDDNTDPAVTSSSDVQSQPQTPEKYTAYKFWVHSDNLLEVKTYILRRLPAVVYSEPSSKSPEPQADPTLNSLYFDSPDFTLYDQKREKKENATSLRIRWYGQLKDNPELHFEQKIVHENGTSEEKKLLIKEKYIDSFIKGEYKMEKSIQKMERQGLPETRIEAFKKTVNDIQSLIKENGLQPILRANYTRTAFQKPLDDKVRISIDTQLAFIREDCIDEDRPCRDPKSWHRRDIDSSAMSYPFSNINQGEISRFPYSVLEIKVKDDATKKQPQWVQDLMGSHLVYAAPGFSKFLQGAVSLFEDNVNDYPSWHGNLTDDIRKDPQAAWEEDQSRKAKQAENDLVIGSFIGTSQKASASFKPAVSSPVGKSYMEERMIAEERAGRRSNLDGPTASGDAGNDEDETGGSSNQGGYGTLASVFPSFSLSRYAQSRRSKSSQLPPGVTKPTQFIKDSGPLQVEPKVWLANERTFLKWQHICILLGSLAVSLYTAAGEDEIAEAMGIAYIVIAIFAGSWGYWMHYTRRQMIVDRSGKDFDNLIGPMIVSAALMVSLLLNFFFKYKQAMAKYREDGLDSANMMLANQTAEEFKIDL